MSDDALPEIVFRVATPTSAVMRKVGGKLYPERIESKCKTCQSPYRGEIESKLLSSYGYAKIARSLPPDADLTERNIADHVNNGHLPLAEDVRRVIIEDRAKERGLSIEGHHTALADHVTLARLGVQRTVERLNSGEIEPDVRDGVAFANLLIKIEEMAGEELDQEVMFQTFLSWMQAIRKHTSPEQFKAISADVSGDPVLRAMTNRHAIAANSTEVEQ